MLPSVSSDAIKAAMARFDAELRNTPEWVNWQADRRIKFAINESGILYPAKQIVSMATNAPLSSFGGVTEANGYVKERGFRIESIQPPSKPEVRIALHDLLLKRMPNAVPESEAYDALADEFHLPANIRDAEIPNGEKDWEHRVRFAGRKLVNCGLMDGSERGLYRLLVRSEPKLWMEKVLVEGRPDRLQGDYALGQALWSPQRDRADGDTYPSMREVQPGDIVIHLIDNQRIAGVSVVASYASTDFVGLPNTEWAGTKSYLVKLKDFQRCDPPLERKLFLGDSALAPELRAIRATYKNLFYDRDLNLNQGFYLTGVPTELAALLNRAYRDGTGKSLPHLEAIRASSPPGPSENQETTDNSKRHQQIWVYAPGQSAEFWDEFYAEGIMAIGWDGLGDLSEFSDLEEVKERLKEIYESDADPTNNALACYEFASEIRPGDLVFAKRGRGRIIGYGIVLGDYAFDAERPHFKNYRRIRWDGRGDWEAERQLPTKTLTNITDDEEHVEKLKRLVGLVQGGDAPEPTPVTEREPFTIQNAVDGLFMDQDEFEKILRVWRGKKNLILQGPPGVGKTYIARRLGYALLGYKDPSRVGMVQFHQSYSYEDFVQGYRPTATGLQLRNGIFLEFCAKAARDFDTDYVFIIDEINRGNLSRIFGELMMLLEPDKRGSNWSVPLTYATSAEEQFSVPKNLYLLGLMNTADRSLAMVDYALRRRFTFWTLEPKIDAPAFRAMLELRGITADRLTRLITVLGEVNEDIAADHANLGPGYRIGHSFFCQDITNGGDSSTWLSDIIETEIVPLIKEYWVDNSTKTGRWIDQLRSIA
jgi:hypothetical protein